jgi:hypothetical protein
MIFDISYNEALRIQRSQLAWYRPMLGLKGTRSIMRSTKPCPCGIHPDLRISIIKINELVPRGGDIEYWIQMFGYTRWGRRFRDYKGKGPSSDERIAWHDAIQRGLV